MKILCSRPLESAFSASRARRRMSGDRQKGEKDGANNIKALADAFGEQAISGTGPEILLFLDVEPEHPLSPEYFIGWSAAVSTGTNVLPAVYLNKDDRRTWDALQQAVDQGHRCDGLWVAHYVVSTGCADAPAWNDGDVMPRGLKNSPAPLLGWQYCQECDDIDYSIVNPAHVDVLAAGLAHPRAALFDGIAHIGLDQRGSIVSALKEVLAELKGLQTETEDERSFLFPDGIGEISVRITGPDHELSLTIREAQRPNHDDSRLGK
jgi:hypothetical protein